MSLFIDSSSTERGPSSDVAHSPAPAATTANGKRVDHQRSVIAKVDELVYAEDLSTGLCWTSEFRRVTAADVADFARLTGDNDPLHRDASESSPFGRPIAHGLLGLSILAGLGTRYPNASTLALVGIEDWEFIAPVFFGDSVQVRNEVVEVQPHGRRAVRVRWLRQLINDQGRVVQQGHFITLVGSRSRIVSSKPR